MNPNALFKIKGAWDTFTANHPKFPLFVKAVNEHGVQEGTIIEIAITTPEGQVINTNVKLTASDMELFESLKQIGSV